MREKKEFSERLRAAMKARGLEASSAVLEQEFNARWLGRPVGRQTAWKWLNGQAIPTQDKLQELAKLLKVEPQQLRFGDHVLRHLRAGQKRWDEGAGYVERETFDAFLQLSGNQRKIVREIILAFAKVNKEPDA
jgi:transcriptional regulator with XRE-family HTH domain